MKANLNFNEEVQQYNKNVAEPKTNKHNNEIICTKISHPPELCYSTLLINDDHFFPLVFFLYGDKEIAFPWENECFLNIIRDTLSITKTVKQIKVYRRIFKIDDAI